MLARVGKERPRSRGELGLGLGLLRGQDKVGTKRLSKMAKIGLERKGSKVASWGHLFRHPRWLLLLLLLLVLTLLLLLEVLELLEVTKFLEVSNVLGLGLGLLERQPVFRIHDDFGLLQHRGSGDGSKRNSIINCRRIWGSREILLEVLELVLHLVELLQVQLLLLDLLLVLLLLVLQLHLQLLLWLWW